MQIRMPKLLWNPQDELQFDGWKWPQKGTKDLKRFEFCAFSASQWLKIQCSILRPPFSLFPPVQLKCRFKVEQSRRPQANRVIPLLNSPCSSFGRHVLKKPQHVLIF